MDEDERIVGTHSIDEVKTFVNKMIKDGAKNASTWDQRMEDAKLNVRAGEAANVTIWLQSMAPTNATSRLQDAATAFMFGLKQGVFTGREELEDIHLDALKEWLRVVSLTFPGNFNRKLVADLYEKTVVLHYLDYETWQTMVSAWQADTVTLFATQKVDNSAPTWQRIPDLFDNEGIEYHGCALYTCGQWNLFHMMTVNGGKDNTPPSDEVLMAVVSVSRRFMRYFFGCVQCREHFLKENPLDVVKSMAASKNKTRLLPLWLWKMHNSVNTRVGHHSFPLV